MKFALVVNLSKERAIKYAKKISLFLLDKNAEIAMIEECSQYFKAVSYTHLTLPTILRV